MVVNYYLFSFIYYIVIGSYINCYKIYLLNGRHYALNKRLIFNECILFEKKKLILNANSIDFELNECECKMFQTPTAKRRIYKTTSA